MALYTCLSPQGIEIQNYAHGRITNFDKKKRRSDHQQHVYWTTKRVPVVIKNHMNFIITKHLFCGFVL